MATEEGKALGWRKRTRVVEEGMDEEGPQAQVKPPHSKKGKDGKDHDDKFEAPPAGAALSAKKGGKQKAMSYKENELWEAVAKLCLNNAQGMRDLNSILLSTWLVPAGAATPKEMKAEAKDYVKRNKDNKEEAPPHINIAGAMVEGLIKDIDKVLKDEPDDKESQETGNNIKMQLQDYDNELSKLQVTEAVQWIPFTRLRKTYLSNFRKVQYNINNPGLKRSVDAAFEYIGAVRKLGRAPNGQLERIIMRNLDGTFSKVDDD